MVSIDAVIIMDNAKFHRKSALVILLQNHNSSYDTQIELLFLPPYDPIEHYWANFEKKSWKDNGSV